jgi:DNA-binding IclR family transcriptional regulator
MRSTVKKDKPNAIEKTLEILITFADNNRELGTSEISKLTGIHKATTSRILAHLVDYGLVSHNDESKKYNLGPLAYRLGVSRTSRSIQSFVDIAKPYIDKLRDCINESISLEVWTGNRTVACYFAESRSPLRVAMMPADILPLYAPAGAKAILSFVCKENIDRLLEEPFEQFTANTIPTLDELQQRLITFNKQGYAVDNEELFEGIYAIGVPIFDYLSKPVAAICAVMPATRLNDCKEANTVAELKRTAKIISKKIKDDHTLGYYAADH